MQRGRALIIAAALVSATLVLLTACTPKDHVSARIEDGEVHFVTCDGQQADRILVLAGEKPVQPSALITVWEANGDTFLDAGTQITFGVAPPGLTTTVVSELDPKGYVIQFYAENLDTSGVAFDSKFGQFDGDALSADTWTKWDGSTSTKPCD